MKTRIFKLTGKVQHYQWGGSRFLPQLLNISNDQERPFAEYWLGAHDNASSRIEGAEPELLSDYIKHDVSVLGEKVKRQFGKLPYLLKVLDVKQMLSIQVHPSKKAAEKEFHNENKSGIPIHAPNRNYKDDNHKPELMTALGDFWLLHGFKSPVEIIFSLQHVPEFKFMLRVFEQGGYENLYRLLMEMDQENVNAALQPLLDRIIPLYKENKLKKEEPDFWAARAALTYDEKDIIDRGIFSIYLLNLVHLRKDEAIFQDAGVLHAYLEGQNMEIMANSDNVLRGGLTPKHIDVKELMKHVNFAPVIPAIIRPSSISDYELIYHSPAPDFQLSKISLPADRTLHLASQTVEIFFVIDGEVDLRDKEGGCISLHKGDAATTVQGAVFTITSKNTSDIYRASVPGA